MPKSPRSWCAAALADHPDEKIISLLAISVSHLEQHSDLQLELPLGLADEGAGPAQERHGALGGRPRRRPDPRSLRMGGGRLRVGGLGTFPFRARRVPRARRKGTLGAWHFHEIQFCHGRQRLISTLLQGPTADEAAEGLRTAIPSGTRLLAVDLKDGVLTIDLSKEFLLVQGSEQRVEVAELVFTATGTPKVDSVLFVIEGTLKEVPVDDGSLSAQPLTRFSFPSLDPIRLPPPTPGGGLPTTTTTTTTTVPPAPATTAAAPPTT